MLNKPQLFLLHFAGGNAYSFEYLKVHLRNKFDCYSLELPGRGRRMAESVLTSKKDAVEDYLKQIRSLRNGSSYLIFGHSMGASLGRYVAQSQEQINDPATALIVSGNAGPGSHKKKDRYLMSDQDLIEDLTEMGGLSDELLKEPELLAFFLPIIRGDLEILEKQMDVPDEIEPIKTPISVLMGREEENVEKIENWKRFSQGEVRLKVLDGNHFFIQDHPNEVANNIIESYDRALAY